MFTAAAAPLFNPTFAPSDLTVTIVQWLFFAVVAVSCWILGRKRGASSGPRSPFASKLLAWVGAGLALAVVAALITMNIAGDEHRAKIKTWLEDDYTISATADQVKELADGGEVSVIRDGRMVLIKFRADAENRVTVSEMKGERTIEPAE